MYGIVEITYATKTELLQSPAFNMIPKKLPKSRSAQVDDLQWQILHLDMTLVGVLSDLRQPKRLSYETIRGHALCRSAALDAGETPPSLDNLKSFSSPGGLSGGRYRSCATNKIVSISSKEH